MTTDIFSSLRHWGVPLCALFFLCALHWNGRGGDLGYWPEWMSALSLGYEHVHANYPPLLLHWFWLLALLFDVLTLQVDSLGNISSDHANWAEAGFWQDIPERGALTIVSR